LASTRSPIRVVVVATTLLVREGLARYLDESERFSVAGTARSGAEAVGVIRACHPDAVLLDVNAAGDVGALRTIVTAEPATPVVAFGMTESEEVVIACAEAGVAGYADSTTSLAELVTILVGALRKELVCSPQVAGTLLRRVGALARGQGDPPERLTSRETQVIALVDEGLSNKEIARRLNIELATVKNHVHNIINKVDASGRSEAAARVRALRDRGI
jgi:DNA-binding NarL/FixJ family response regulator